MDSHQNPEPAAERAGRPLEETLQKVRTARQAERVIDEIEAGAGTLSEQDAAQSRSPQPGRQQAAALEKAAVRAAPGTEAAAVLLETARQSAAARPADLGALDEAVAATLGGPDLALGQPAGLRRARRLLREALIHRLKPLQALDATLFIRVNHLPHPRWMDRAMGALSWVMTGGHGWMLVLAAGFFFKPRHAARATLEVVPALWLATSTVEYPIKALFRRRRPFLSLVRAIVVGQKPGSHSFPSGHSASAFAGALLLSSHYPRLQKPFLATAALVAFSRVYLGAHYPGDVVSGSICGALLGRLFSRLLRGLWRLIFR